MRAWRIIHHRARALFRKDRLDAELAEEMKLHVDLQARENVAAGMSPEEARYAALRQFGHADGIQETVRRQRGIAWFENFIRDLHFGIRLWMKQPGSFLLGVIALTLGIGLVTFSLCAINCIFFGKLPFPEAERLVYATIPESTARAFIEQQSTFEGLSTFSLSAVNFAAAEAPSHRNVCFIGATFLDILRAKPMIGRGFLPGEDKPTAEPVALMGYDLWQREYHGDPMAVGSIIHLDGQPRTIVGIMPEGFKFPINNDLWVPAEPGVNLGRGWGFGFGCLKSTATIANARAELNLIAARMAPSEGVATRAQPILVGPYTRFLNMKGPHGPVPGTFAMLFITSLVLCIACANVASLIFANATKRGTELAIRSALGATRGRLISQMLVESLILVLCGSAGGILVVGFLARWLDRFMQSDADFSQAPFWMHLRLDFRLMLALIALAFLTTLLAGLWPALLATKRDVNELIKNQAIGVSGMRLGKFQRFLVSAQIALSLVILIQAFTILNFSRRLKQVRLPFDPSAILTTRVALPPSADARSFFDQLERQLANLQGVRAMALSNGTPVSGYGLKPIAMEGVDYPRLQDHPYAGAAIVSSGYFRTINLSILEGRAFDARDLAGTLPVAVVNATFARLFLPPGNVLGRRFQESPNGEWLTVVGCVSDLDTRAWSGQLQPLYFVPGAQRSVPSMTIILDGSGSTMDWAKALRTQVAALRPDVAIYNVATIQGLIDHDTMGYHMAAVLLGICGAGALFLAMLGIFGLITLSVNQRTREIGIRLALGATGNRIVGTILTQALRQVAVGLAVGGLVAWALAGLLTHTIAGYPAPNHPALIYLSAVTCLILISLIAAFIPANRAGRVDPIVALRYE